MLSQSDQEQSTDHTVFNQIKKGGIHSLWRNRKISSIAILIGANIFNNLVVFIINIIVARQFGPDIFGIFSLAISVMVSMNLIADLGVNLTMVRFYNLYSADKERQNILTLSLLIWKISVILTLILIAWPLAFMATKVFGLHHMYMRLFFLSISSAGIFGLWLYFHSYLQAHKRFKKLAIYIALCAFLRLLCFFAVYIWLSASVNLTLTFSAMYLIPLVIAILVGLVPVMIESVKRGIPKVSIIKNNLFEILKYSKWVAISGLCHSFIYRGVQFILATRTTKFELGIFSAGFVFTLAFTPFNTAVRTVFFPHVTAYKGKSDMVRHLGRMKKIFPYYVGFIIISICCLAAIQAFFLGNKYTTALPVFLITTTALTMTIYLGLASMLVHTLMRPEIDAYTNIARLIVSSILVFFLAPSMGAVGGALSYALPLVLGEILMVLYVRKSIYEKK